MVEGMGDCEWRGSRRESGKRAWGMHKCKGWREVVAAPRESGNGQEPGKHRWGHEPMLQGDGARGALGRDLTLGR